VDVKSVLVLGSAVSAAARVVRSVSLAGHFAEIGEIYVHGYVHVYGDVITG
jgi:hypothetical protein